MLLVMVRAPHIFCASVMVLLLRILGYRLRSSPP
jgi:hypothetical protein